MYSQSQETKMTTATLTLENGRIFQIDNLEETDLSLMMKYYNRFALSKEPLANGYKRDKMPLVINVNGVLVDSYMSEDKII